MSSVSSREMDQRRLIPRIERLVMRLSARQTRTWDRVQRVLDAIPVGLYAHPTKDWISIEIEDSGRGRQMIWGDARGRAFIGTVTIELMTAWEYFRDVCGRLAKMNRLLDSVVQSLLIDRLAMDGYRRSKWAMCEIRVNGRELLYQLCFDRIGGYQFKRVSPPTVILDALYL